MPDPLPPAHTDLAQLWQWAQQGWLMRIDAAFAQWVFEQAASANAPPHPGSPHPSLPYIAAVLSALQTRGHSCLPIDRLSHEHPGHERHLRQRLSDMLSWPLDEPAQAALHTLYSHLPASHADWLAALQSPLVEAIDIPAHLPSDAAPPSAANPLLALDTPAPPLVLHLGKPPHSSAPQPLRLYLRRYHDLEQTVAHGLLERARHTVALAHAPVAATLAMLFDHPTPAPQATARPARRPAPATPNWQKTACALGLRRHLSVITGGPGTGKTYTAARLMAAALALAPDPAAVRIRLAAPTGKAAARLSESLQQALAALEHLPEALRQALAHIPPARTLHALLGARPGTRALQHHAGNPLALDWLFVDEASMVDLPMMAALLQALPASARLVLLGDKDQLASVEAGAVLGDICEHAEQGQYSPATARYLHATCGQSLPEQWTAPPIAPPPLLAQATAMLRESRRFGSDIGQLARIVQSGDEHALAQALHHVPPPTQAAPDAAAAVWWKEPANLDDALQRIQGGSGPWPGYGALADAVRDAPAWPQPPARNGDATQEQGQGQQHWQHQHTAWVWRVLEQLARFRILCATRSGPWGVEGMNALVLQHLAAAGLPVKPGWFAGRAVMVTRNDAHLGIFNGDVGIALPAAHDRRQLRVYFPPAAQAEAGPDGPRLRSFSVSRMQHVETAFAMTVHKSQGSEFEHVLLCLSAHTGPLLTRELLYTGLTRARAHLSYLAPATGLWPQAMRRRTQRASGLAELLHRATDDESNA